MVGRVAESSLFCPELRNFVKNLTELWNFVSPSETEKWVFLVRKNEIYNVGAVGIFTKVLHLKEIFGDEILVRVCLFRNGAKI